MTGHEERRRSDDVYRALERDVFPRLGEVETKIGTLDGNVNKLIQEGCAHRSGDLQRTQFVEASMVKIFDKIDTLGRDISVHQVTITKQVGDINTDMVSKVSGVRIWVLTSCVLVLLATLSVLTKDVIIKLLFG